MSESTPTATADPEKLTPYLHSNWVFMLVLAALILVPPSIAFFAPPSIVGLGDFIWLSAAWLAATILLFIGDETFVPGKNNLSTGATHKASLSHRLISNPIFVGSVAVLVFAPAPLAFYGPAIVKAGADWLWLVAAYLLAIAAVATMYLTIRMVEGSSPRP